MTKMYMEIQDTIQKFIEFSQLANLNISDNNIDIEFLIAPHTPPSKLPTNTFAIYMFFYEQKCLKVGKAGVNSHARYVSQHYGFSAPSTLAKSIFANYLDYGLSEPSYQDIKVWIKSNTTRVNVILDSDIGIEGLNLLEAFLQCYFKPKYEGFKSQRKVS